MQKLFLSIRSSQNYFHYGLEPAVIMFRLLVFAYNQDCFHAPFITTRPSPLNMLYLHVKGKVFNIWAK